MAIAKVLLVDDDQNVRYGLGEYWNPGFRDNNRSSVLQA